MAARDPSDSDDSTRVRRPDGTPTPVDLESLPGFFSEPPSEKAPVAAAKGDLLAGRYSLLQEIGRGALGVVHKALDTQNGQTVAVKFLHDNSTQDGSVLDRMIQEVSLVRKIEHPRICKVFCLAAHDGRPFLAMEILRGPDLSQYLTQRGGAIAMEEALALMGPVAEGIDVAHKSRVIHLDLKPRNLMFDRPLDEEAVVKILDFGLAKLGPGGGGTNRPEQLGGSPAYCAPEQLQGTAPRRHVDLYAFAVTVYELIAGTPPFLGENLEERKRTEAPPRIPGYSGAVHQVFVKALSPRPKARYPSAVAFLEALEYANRRPWGTYLLAALTLLGLGALLYSGRSPLG